MGHGQTAGAKVLAGGIVTQLYGSRADQVDRKINSLLLSEVGRSQLRAVYRAMIDAGAEVVAAPSYRCQRDRLISMGLHDGAGLAWPVHAAVGTVSALTQDQPQVRVVGTLWPLSDSHRPDLVPAADILDREYLWLATELRRAGVTHILAETMSSIPEGLAATRAVCAAGAVPWTSFACRDDGRLLSGESMADAATAVSAAGAQLVGVNCSSAAATSAALQTVGGVEGICLGVWPNLEGEDSDAEEFGLLLRRWLRSYPLAVVGGCCGASADHVRAAVAASRAA